MNPDLVIGIDSSTSATKAIAWDRNGRAIAEGRAPIAMSNPEPGFFEQDPNDWWRSTAQALKEVSAKVDPARIAPGGISNQAGTLRLFAGDGTALRPGLVWLDDRARAQQKSFGESFGAEQVHAVSGNPLGIIPGPYRRFRRAGHDP